MSLDEKEILRILMASRERISAAVWLVARNAQTAEDIFQNVVLKALTKNVEFEAEGAVLSWAFITARREAIDWQRKHSRESLGIEDSVLQAIHGDWLAESTKDASARIDALRKCVGALPTKSRDLLKLRYADGFSCREVAQHLDTGLSAIYKRVSRLHHSLKDCIQLRLHGPT